METFLKKYFKKYKTFLSKNKFETKKFSKKLSEEFKDKDIIGLVGILGAGKTYFIKGIASYFNIKEKEVVSPTFNIVKEYKGEKILYHFDLYRLNDIKDLEEIGYREYLNIDNSIVLIEWADKIKEIYADFTWIIQIIHENENKRTINVYKKTLKIDK